MTGTGHRQPYLGSLDRATGGVGGNQQKEMRYHPFGETRGESGASACDYKFTGK